MAWDRNNSRQSTLALVRPRPEPTEQDLAAAYERCIQNKASMPFDRAMAVPSIALALKSAARAEILKRGGR